MDGPAREAYDWTIAYRLSATKRGGVFGRTYSLDQAVARINVALQSLPATADEVRGELVLMGERRQLRDERSRVCVLAKINSQELTWIHARASFDSRDVR